MLKHQIIITVAIVLAVLWLAFRFKERRRGVDDEDQESETNE